VRAELAARLRAWAGSDESPEWLLPRYYQAFEIETVCRALYTLARREPSTKPRAVAWALETLAEPWRELVELSQEHRADKTPDDTGIPAVMRFARWVATQALAESKP
jgi:hypothetical protein